MDLKGGWIWEKGKRLQAIQVFIIRGILFNIFIFSSEMKSKFFIKYLTAVEEFSRYCVYHDTRIKTVMMTEALRTFIDFYQFIVLSMKKIKKIE